MNDPKTKPSSLPLTMQIRFLEIIQYDINRLTRPLGLSPAEFNIIALPAKGFIDNLSLAYSDQGFNDFLQLLNDLQDDFRVLSQKETDKNKHLHTMELRVTEFLEALTGNPRAARLQKLLAIATEIGAISGSSGEYKIELNDKIAATTTDIMQLNVGELLHIMRSYNKTYNRIHSNTITG